jgi:alcohol dehydrogenase
MRMIEFLLPRKIQFGSGCLSKSVDDIRKAGFRRVFLLTVPPLAGRAGPFIERIGEERVRVHDQIEAEPEIEDCEAALEAARDFDADAVVGIGGGSVMDVAKLVAALVRSDQGLEDVFGINLLQSRHTHLSCLPTSAGTGSEVSPNAILIDRRDLLKKAVVSPFLVPDAAYVDPELTLTVPPAVTASTGMDALTHCIEVYTNRHAHPMTDLYALEGVRLIAKNLERAVKNGADLEARECLALGSLYGGMCLGPVNTAAVHALAYSLGGEFHIPHGVSNAMLLPAVMDFNIPASPRRYAEVAMALGAEPGNTDEETARRGVRLIRDLNGNCGVPMSLEAVGIPEEAIPRMAAAAMKVTRLLKNNPRELSVADAEAIYRTMLER